MDHMLYSKISLFKLVGGTQCTSNMELESKSIKVYMAMQKSMDHGDGVVLIFRVNS